MTMVTPWTVVSHTADESLPASTLPHLLTWLDQQPDVALHSVLWSAGWVGPDPYRHGRFHDVGAAHERLTANLLRGVGLARVAGGLAGRAVRSVLKGVPRTGVLYLNSAHSAPVLRYLPPGDRVVVTHLHAIDRSTERPIPSERVASLIEATHIWLAADPDTLEWASQTWGIDRAGIQLVPAPTDQSGVRRSIRVTDSAHLRLAIRGSTWFRTDHSGRLVQLIQKMRPGLDIEILWADVQPEVRHISPILHDLRQLGVEDRVTVPATADELLEGVPDVDVVAFSCPDDDAWGIVAEAQQAEVPVVCFDTHRCARKLEERGGTVVPYLDLPAMAETVLNYLDKARAAGDEVEAQRRDLRDRAVTTVGPRIVRLIEELRA